VQWTREDDMAGGRYRPIYVHKITAGLDADGRPMGWRHRIVGQSIMTGTPFEGMMKNGVDPTSVEGASTLPYDIPDLKVDLVTTDVGVPVLWWRSVGSTHTAYSTEVMIDQLAYAAKADPVAFRRDLLENHPRHLGVLDLAAEKADWGSPLPSGKARGVAVHESFHTYVAEVAEIAMRPDGTFAVERVVCAVDCGVPVNPDIIRAQMEGGIGFGLGSVMKSALHLEGGRVVETNYDTFEVLRIDGMPKVEVHIVPSEEPDRGWRAWRPADRACPCQRLLRRHWQARGHAAFLDHPRDVVFWFGGGGESRLAKGDQPAQARSPAPPIVSGSGFISCCSSRQADSSGRLPYWFAASNASRGATWCRAPIAGGRSSYFSPFPVRLRFDLAAASRRCLPILKRTTRVAGIFKRSPVCRLRPGRALRSCTSKRPKPTRFTVSPLPTASSIWASALRNTVSTTAFGCPVSLTTRSIKSPSSTILSCY
jgi:hypothetical protein